MKTKNSEIILLVFALLLVATKVQANAFISGAGGGNWNLGATWGNPGNNTVGGVNGGGVPGAGDTAYITNGSPVTVNDTEAASAITLSKGTGVTLAIATGGNLNVTGTITQSGGSGATPILDLSSGSGTLNLNAAATLFTTVTLNPGTAGSTVNYAATAATVYAATYDNLILSGGGTNIVNSTTAIASGGSLTLSGSTYVANGNNKLSSIGGNLTLSGTSTFTVSGNTTTTIGGNVTLNSGAAFNKTANTTVAGSFIVDAGATYADVNGNSSLTIDGSVTNDGTFSVSGGGNDSTLVLAGSTGTISGGGTLNCQIVTINGAYTLLGGTTLTVGNKNGGIASLLGGTGTLVNQGTVVVTTSEALATAVSISALNSSATGSTFQLNSSGSPNALNATYYNVIFNPTGGSSSLNLSGASLDIAGNLAFGGTSGLAAGLATWPASGDFTIGGILTCTNSGSKLITLPTGIFAAAGFNQSAGTVTLPAGATFQVTGTGPGTWTQSGGTFKGTNSNSTVEFTGAGGAAPNIAGPVATPFDNLTIDAAASAAIADTNSFTVSGDLTVNGGLTVPAPLSGGTLGTGIVNIGSGGVFTVLPVGSGGFLANATGLSDASGTLQFNFVNGAPSTTVAPLQINADASTLSASSATLTVTNAALEAGTLYPLVQFASGTPDTSGFTTQNLPAGASLAVVGSTIYVTIGGSQPPQNPAFSGLTASQSIASGATAITLGGTVSASFPTTYPAIGETVTVTINGNAQNTTIIDDTGDFSFSYNPSTIPAAGTPYPITYSYAGDADLNAATDDSTTLTVTNAVTVGSGSPILATSRNGNQLTLSWDSTTYPGYSVQSQTNSRSGGLGASWSSTGSGTTSPFIITIDPTQPTVFFRLAQ